MSRRSTTRQLLVGPMVILLLAGCAAGGSRTPAPPTRNVPYESANPVLTPGVLDVYAPARAGPWPVVVMLHGYGGNKGDLGRHARMVADLGFVVFSATWGAGLSNYSRPTHDEFVANASQGACAVAFARAHAAAYGGDPGTMIVFGHSGGASVAGQVAFARPEPTAGCLGGATLGTIDALVTWDVSCILSSPIPEWDAVLAADPRVLDVTTPWTYLAERTDLKVVLLSETNPNAGINLDYPLPDAEAVDAFFALRDPSGVLRRQLEANGALADGNLDMFEVQQLLYSVLEANGNSVSLDVMPGSNHVHLSAEGWKVFLAAFPKAAAQD